MNEQRYRSTAGPALASMDNWNAQQNRRPAMQLSSEERVKLNDIIELPTTRPEPAADAVERHPMQGEVWSIIRRAMDTPYRARFERDAIGSEAARKVIALVTAARDAEIREALLSDGAKNASAHRMQELSAQGVWRNHTLAFYGMKAALEHIGLAEEGAER